MRDLPELPEIKDATVGTLRLENILAKRLPNMPTGELDDLGFTNYRQMEAEKLMNEMRYVFDISRQQAARSKALAKAKGRQLQRQAERR